MGKQIDIDWIPVTDRKPECDSMVYVKNEKGWMCGVLASYYTEYDLFINSNPLYSISLTLEVTHWYPLPQ